MPVALETFVKQLTESGVIAPGKLENFIPPKAQPKDAQELARQLVQSKQLTKFQVQEISAGRAKSLILGNYTLVDKIGAGGMGQVFRAEHRRMKRVVAIKMLPPAVTKDAVATARFQREVEAAAKLRHTNIVAADDADEANGVHFLVMEYVEGADLSALVKRDGPLPVGKAVNYILQAARGLEFAHQKGVVHRDIKPANLLLGVDGVVKILDMGLARIESGDAADQAELTGTGAVMGTVDYMAPEQALGARHADARADIYSLGLTLYYLIAGKAAYGGDTLMAKLLAHREEPIPNLQDAQANVPPPLVSIFEQMVAKETDDRYQSMSEVVAALEALGFGGTDASRTNEAATALALTTAARVQLATKTPKKPTRSLTVAASPEVTKHWLAKLIGGLFATIIAPILVTYLLRYLGKKDAPAPAPASVPAVSVAAAPSAAASSDATTAATAPTTAALEEPTSAVANAPSKPAPASLVTDKAAEPQAVNLLALVKPAEHSLPDSKGVKKLWKVEQGALVSPNFGGLLQIPYELPRYYRVDMVVERMSDSGFGLNLFFATAGHQGSVVLDGSRPRLCALEVIDGKPCQDFAQAYRKPMFLMGRPSSVRISIVSSGVVVECDGKTLFDWQGSFDRFSIHDSWPLPKVNQLIIGNQAEFKIHSLALTPITPKLDTLADSAFQRWLNEVGRLTAEKQVSAVAKKLVELNPGFNGKLHGWNGKGTPRIENGAVTEVWFDANNIVDLSPVRGFSGLKLLRCSAGQGGESKLSDLSPLSGMKLTLLVINHTQVSNLTPLQEMKLTVLSAGGTLVSDLSPLRGMPLTKLYCFDTKVSDLSPLEGMKLTLLSCGGTPVSDLSVLAKMTTLAQLKAEGAKISPASAAALQRALPNCKIEWGEAADRDAAGAAPESESNSSKRGKSGAVVSLLQHDTLAGWKTIRAATPINWSVSDGILTNFRHGPSLATQTTYRNFDLRLEFSLPKGCNSGVYLRGRYEIQLYDNPAASKSDSMLEVCGAVYGVVPPTRVVYSGPDRWNTLQARIVDRTVTVRMNDVLIIDAKKIDKVTKSALDDHEAEPGPIMLQSYSAPPALTGAKFRNITITPLP